MQQDRSSQRPLRALETQDAGRRARRQRIKGRGPLPAARPVIPCPRGLHRASFRRLLRLHTRLVRALEALPTRRMAAVARKQVGTRLTNRLRQVRRALGLPVPGPRAKGWYRTGQAAQLLGISPKTLLRYVTAGKLACEWSDGGHYRLFARGELLRFLASRRL